MAYIYIIKNDINDKVYIGKTNYSIQKRFQEHCRDSQKDRNEKRPLYNAMNKYGIEHFFIEKLEECSIEESINREKYWIEYFNSFKYGYNATLGGDGKPYLDYNLIYQTYLQTQSMAATAKICNCCEDSVSFIVHLFLTDENIKQINLNFKSKSVAMLDKNTLQILRTFNSASDAARFLHKDRSANGHIIAVCKGKRKTAYGYHWKYI